MKKNNEILKFTGKRTELEETILNELAQSQKKRGTWYVLTHIWILDIEQRITSLKFIPSEELGYKEESKRFIQGPSQKEKGTRSPEYIWSRGAVNGERTRRKRRGGKESTCD